MIVNSISNFIITDSSSTSDSPGSCVNEQELEDQLTALGERWIHLCVWVEERWSTLREVSTLWANLLTEKDKLLEWLDKAENCLKQMERNPTEDVAELLKQVKQIVVRSLSYN